MIGQTETPFPEVFEGATKTLSSLHNIMKYIPDYYSYWSQVFLMVTLSMERYIIICHGSNAKSILTNRRRKIVYGITLTACCVVPSVYLADYVINEYIMLGLDYIYAMSIGVSTKRCFSLLVFLEDMLTMRTQYTSVPGSRFLGKFL